MTEWTVNNKLNEWYQKRYHIKLPKQYETKSRIFFGGGVDPLAEFALWTWFLKYDSWDFDGVWLDEVRWAYNWFLNSGAIDVYGAWVDGALWSLDWFLATGTINIYGFWSDSEAWA